MRLRLGRGSWMMGRWIWGTFKRFALGDVSDGRCGLSVRGFAACEFGSPDDGVHGIMGRVGASRLAGSLGELWRSYGVCL